MPEVFEPEERRQLFLDFDLAFATKFEPEKTGPYNRSHYMASKLGDFVLAHLLGLRDRVLPTMLALKDWMANQPGPAEARIAANASEAINGGRLWACASG